MKRFLKKNIFKILSIFLTVILISTLSIKAFGTKYESLDFSVR